jgi:DNA invertase Pin-like site-specific DNA recombinase
VKSRKPQVRRDGPHRARRYGRVSTEDQNEDGATSIPDQDKVTAAYCDRKGWLDGGFTHDEDTGTTTDREHWQAIVADCRAGLVDVVVCAKLNRFARSALAGLQQIDELEHLGVDVVLCDIDLDTSTPAGKAMRTVMLAFAQFDRDNLVDQMAKGQYGKARNGRWPSSRTGAPFGLRVEGTGRDAHLVLDEREAATILKAAELLVDERMDKVAACRTLNALGLLPRKAPRWSPDLLREVMSEPARMGVVIWGKPERIAARSGGTPYGPPTPIPGVPAILTPERFELVQRALHRRTVPNPLAAPRVYALSGRLTSPCGQVYHGRARNDLGTSSYRCKGTKWQAWPDWKPCGCPPLRAEDIEARVWAEVTALLGDENRLRDLAHAYLGMAGEDGQTREGELATLESTIATRQKQLSAEIGSYIRAGLDPEAVASAVEQLQDELAALRRRRDDISRLLEDEQARTSGLDALGQLAAIASGRLAHAGLEMQAEVLALLDVQVTVLDRARTPALHVTGTICSAGILDPASARNPGGQHPRRGSGPASAR